jgi:acyl-CoA synthetase (AMP-forming)/AMP-acid ligase II
MEFNLADLYECVADHVPEREALVAGDRRLTYRELDQRANRLAHSLAAAGVGPDDRVGLYLYTCAEYLETMLACFKIRAVPANINYRYVEDELAYLLGDAGLKGLVYSPDLRARVDACRSQAAFPRLAVEVGPEYEALVAAGSAERDFGPRSADDHYLLYTGGTTGLPKGVVWRQEDMFFATMGGGNAGGPPLSDPQEIGPTVLVNRRQRLNALLPPDDPGPERYTTMALGPLIHGAGQWSAWGSFLSGGRVVLYLPRTMDMAIVLRLIEEEEITSLNLVGDATARPLAEELEANPGKYRTASLLLLGSGGSILSADVKERLFAALPSVLGITEAIGSSESPVQGVAMARPGQAQTSLTFAARPETMVVDEDLRPIAPGSGQVGRLATRGRVPLGYHGDPEKTARTFVEIDGQRWALPGDMATIDADGTIHLLGRGSLCINTGGEKVYPEEVEGTLKLHPAIADAVVVGVADPRWGQAVAAVVQLDAAAESDGLPLADLQDWCRTRLAGYKVPRSLHLVDEVQRSAAGKADYAWAKDIATG